MQSNFGSQNTINLQLNTADFSMAQRIADAINGRGGYGSAQPLDARTVQVRVSPNNGAQVRLLAEIQNIDVSVPVEDAKVIINSRTGSVVMNREVKLNTCAVAQGNLSVTVNQQQNRQPA